MKRRLLMMVGTAVLCLAAAGAGVWGCGRSEPGAGAGETKGPKAGRKSRLVVFLAASLTQPFARLEEMFEAEHPGVDVVCETSSSRVAIRKVTELKRDADVVASADEKLLRDLMVPDHAKWVALFAKNRIVIAYTNQSRYKDEINENNWYEVLLRKDVRFGYASPDVAPVGYQTLQVWKLADLHYGVKPGEKTISERLLAACPPQNIRQDVNELLSTLGAFTLDYAFVFRSVALQHHLEWLRLPAEIDLGDEGRAEAYRRARVEIAGKARGETMTEVGAPILYGACIPTDAPNAEGAAAFLELLLGPRGQKVMQECFQEPVAPAICTDLEAAPASLRSLMRPAKP